MLQTVRLKKKKEGSMTLAYKVSLISPRCCSERRQQPQQMSPPWLFQALPSLRSRIYSLCARLWSHGIKIGGGLTGPGAEQSRGLRVFFSCPTAPHVRRRWEGTKRSLSGWSCERAGGSSSLAAAGDVRPEFSVSGMWALIKKQWGSGASIDQVIQWEWSPGGIRVKRLFL